jgi:hypothetical protein
MGIFASKVRKKDGALDEETPIKAPKIRKKALLIGINYINTPNELYGCINDCFNVKRFLLNNEYFNSDEIVVMNDFSKGDEYPSKRNILKQLDKLVKFSKSHKNKLVYLFISYSGHGAQEEDLNGDESDGQDEVLCPIDSKVNGYISDDIIKSKLVDKLKDNVTLVMLVDACHSGTIVDLKYNYKFNSDTSCKILKSEDTKCNVVLISGCEDDKSSVDAFLLRRSIGRYEYQGVLTACFLDNYYDGISYVKLIKSMREWQDRYKYSQYPQLSSGKMIDITNSVALQQYKKTDTFTP